MHYWFLVRRGVRPPARRRTSSSSTTSFPWGQRSGTLLSELDRIRDEGTCRCSSSSSKGSLAVKDRIAGAVTIFVDAPLDELERRLRGRATESGGEIEERIALAREQKELAGRLRLRGRERRPRAGRGRVRRPSSSGS